MWLRLRGSRSFSTLSIDTPGRDAREDLFETFLEISGPEGLRTPLNGGSNRKSNPKRFYRTPPWPRKRIYRTHWKGLRNHGQGPTQEPRRDILMSRDKNCRETILNYLCLSILGAHLRGRSGRTATQRSKKGSEMVLGRVWGRVLRRVRRRVLRRVLRMGFTVQKGSEKGWFSEGVLERGFPEVPRSPLGEYAPLGVRLQLSRNYPQPGGISRREKGLGETQFGRHFKRHFWRGQLPQTSFEAKNVKRNDEMSTECEHDQNQEHQKWNWPDQSMGLDLDLWSLHAFEHETHDNDN